MKAARELFQFLSQFGRTLPCIKNRQYLHFLFVDAIVNNVVAGNQILPNIFKFIMKREQSRIDRNNEIESIQLLEKLLNNFKVPIFR